MNKLFSLTLLILTGFTATSRCMEPFDMPFDYAQDRPAQEQSAVSTLKQIASKNVAAELIQPRNLEAFIENPDYVQGLAINEEISNAIATQIMKKTAIPKSLFNSLIQKRKLQGHTNDFVSSAAFSPDNEWLASAFGETVYLSRRTNDGTQLVSTLHDHTDNVRTIAFSPDNKWLASASSDETVCLYKLTDEGAQLVTKLEDHTDNVTAVAFSPDSKWLASASWDKTVCLYNLTDEGAQLVTTLRDHTEYVTAVFFSSDNKWLVSASWDKTVCLHRLTGEGAQLVTKLEDHINVSNDNGFSTMAISHDSKWIASASCDNIICLIKLTDEGAQPSDILQDHSENNDECRAVAFSPDSKRLAFASKNTVYLYRLTDEGAQLAATLENHTGNVTAIAFSPDSKWLASASWDKTVCLYRLTDEGAQLVTSLKDHIQGITTVTFSLDSKQIAFASGNTLYLYNLELLHEFTQFIESNLFLEHTLLLHACFKNKISLQEHPHICEYFAQLPQAVQVLLAEQGYIELFDFSGVQMQPNKKRKIN